MTVWCAGRNVIPDSHLYRVTNTRCRIGTVIFSWWWAHSCPKHVEKSNKYIKKNCSPSWFYLQNYDFLICVCVWLWVCERCAWVCVWVRECVCECGRACLRMCVCVSVSVWVSFCVSACVCVCEYGMWGRCFSLCMTDSVNCRRECVIR
jgi:hypothetical protein